MSKSFIDIKTMNRLSRLSSYFYILKKFSLGKSVLGWKVRHKSELSMRAYNI